jgi:hypothetical protein
MKMLRYAVVMVLLVSGSCKKESNKNLRYFEVARRDAPAADWRDNSFVIATSDPKLIDQALQQIALPTAQRRLVNGRLVQGSGGYNTNQSYTFKWHFDEKDWQLTDLSIEIYDGRPYSDIDLHLDYWLDSVKRFAPWGYSIRQEIIKQ